ncbi:GtrA family protein [Candidatus Saccharibacteria bacterium]|nr:MAG: GtrA family protein [Candidatus Saccharibacteria bacterium]
MVSIQKILQRYRNLLLYGLIGFTGAAIDYLFYVLFYKVCGIPPEIASFLSVSIGIANNFILNAKFNFKVSDKLLKRFGSFYAIGLVGAILSSVLIYIMVNLMNIDPLVAKLITIPPVVLAQFIFNKMISFRYNEDESETK